MNSQMKRDMEWGMGESWVQELLSCGVAVHHPPSGDAPATWKLSEPPIIGIFLIWAQSIINSHLQPSSPLWRIRSKGENSKLLIMAWGLWWPAPIQKPTQSHLNRTKYSPSALITQEITRILGALCRNQGQRPIYIFYYLTVSLLSGISVLCYLLSNFLKSLFICFGWFSNYSKQEV